ncbi:MAG: sigma 54-interacting transcriptional regulator [Lysobacteraceae bacterium]
MSIRFTLSVLDPASVTPSLRQLSNGIYRLGRDAACDIRVDAEGVSRIHLEIDVLSHGAVIRDLGSTNGTWIDGQNVDRVAVHGSAVLSLGNVRLQLLERSGPGAELVQGTSLPVALPQASAQGVVAIADATRTGTVAESLFAALRAALVDFEHWNLSDALAELAARWSWPAAQIRDGQARVLASVGAAKTSLCLAEGRHFSLWVDGEVGEWPLDAKVMLIRALDAIPPPVRSDSRALPHDTPWSGVRSSHPGWLRQQEALSRVARSKVGILLFGETGTGKELSARWVHACSPRKDGPLVAINCAAMPSDLLEAELFGVERGAATGVDARPGVFERANGGTLFLDELGDMPLATQVRLLRALEEGRIHRIGGKQLISVDVRLVGATNKDLHEEVNAGRFRLDLYHRLAGFELTLLPLRERRCDIQALALHFFFVALKQNDVRSPGMTQDVLMRLQSAPWPGNIRELRQVIDASVAMLQDGEALDLMHLPARLANLPPPASRPFTEEAPDATGGLESRLFAAERAALIDALQACDGRHECAWNRLRIGKTSFYKKLREHGLGKTDAMTGEPFRTDA